MGGGSQTAGSTNQKVYNEQQRLMTINDYLFLEVLDQVLGYNLGVLRERLLAEALFCGYYRPYLV